MAIQTLLSAVLAANGVPTAVKAVGSIQCVAGSSLVDGERVIVPDGTSRMIFEFDTDGLLSAPALHAIRIPVSGLTADQVRDALVAAINGCGLKLTAVNGAAGELNLTNKEHGPNNVPIRETVVNAGFTVNGFVNGALSGVRVARDMSVIQGIEIVSTGASAPASITAKLWGYTWAVATWVVVKTFATLSLNGNNLAHYEVLRDLEIPDVLYLELAGTFNSASVNAVLTDRMQLGT